MTAAVFPSFVSIASPADLVGLLLDIVGPSRHEQTLQRTRTLQLKALRKLEKERLAAVEQGWEANWLLRYTNQQAVLLEINRILAERYGD